MASLHEYNTKCCFSHFSHLMFPLPMQDCEIDSSLLPSLLMTVKKTEQWTEPPHGTLYQVIQ